MAIVFTDTLTSLKILLFYCAHSVQDQRPSRDSLDHGTFNQLRVVNQDALEQTRKPLDSKRRGHALSTGRLDNSSGRPTHGHSV